jgi:hypothetical protein
MEMQAAREANEIDEEDATLPRACFDRLIAAALWGDLGAMAGVATSEEEHLLPRLGDAP